MKSNWVVGLMLGLPVAVFSACSSDDDTAKNNGGAGGTTSGAAGRANNGGANAPGGFGGNGSGAVGGLALGGEAGDENAGRPNNEAGESGEGGAAGAVAVLNDAQILKVLISANDGEVTAAEVAKPSLQNSAAVSFAQMMIDDHSAANVQTLALVSMDHLAPEASGVSESLDADTSALLVVLSLTPAASFDKVYIDSQVTVHQKVLGLIDSTLLPDASAADIKALLGTLRASVVTHLAHAQTVSATLP